MLRERLRSMPMPPQILSTSAPEHGRCCQESPIGLQAVLPGADGATKSAAPWGIAERETEVANAAFTNVAAVSVLRSAISAAEQLSRSANPVWAQIADKIVIPMRGQIIISHDGYRTDEEKAERLIH